MAVTKTCSVTPANGKYLLLPTEKATLAYALLTTVLVGVFWREAESPVLLLLPRLAIIAGTLVLAYAGSVWPSVGLRLVRTAFPLALLSFWYPDTYEFCRHLPNLDHVFASADQWLCGFQPSLRFSETCQGWAWSELFHLGYFSYYPLIAATCILPLFLKAEGGFSRRMERFERVAFVVLTGFYLYYVVYLFLPVAGPQFYFSAIGPEQAAAGVFLPVGDYFNLHADLQPASVPKGLFAWLVETMQTAGERPTAAFPSSHVGMSTVMLVLLFRLRRAVGWTFVPLYVLLCASTVYIQAHYLVDVLGGWLSALAIVKGLKAGRGLQ